jgi:nitrile hydratase
VALRTKALESLLIEKGLLSSDVVDEVVRRYEQDIGPLNGAKVVARAWIDPAYKRRLLEDGTAAIAA